MEEKIKKINTLNLSIQQLEDFLSLLNKSNIDSGYGEKKYPRMNEFSMIRITSRIYTGNDNPQYSKTLEEKDVINELSQLMKPLIKSKIDIKKLELESLLK